MRPEITTTKIDLSLVSALALPHQSEGRSPGFHVTDLRDEGHVLAGRKPKSDFVGMEGLADMGLMFEAVVRPWIMQDCAEAGLLSWFDVEVVDFEGITANLDGLAASRTGLEPHYIVLEVKLRFGGISDPRDNEDWMVQAMAYCKMYSTPNWWCYAGYIPRSGPPNVYFRKYELIFSQSDIDTNWAMLQNVKRHVSEHGWITKENA